MARSRSFCFTDFVCEKEFYSTFADDNYLICGEEACPDTGRRHWQGYVYFKNQKRADAIRRLFQPRHIEIAKGTPKQNIDYCKKDGQIIIERGVPPNQGARSDLDSIGRSVKEERLTIRDIAERHPGAFLKYGRNMEKLCDLYEPKRDWVPDVRLLWGPTGTGKSHKALVELSCTPVDYESGFIQGYNGEDNVVFEEFDWRRWSVEKERSVWLRLMDRYAMSVNVKGGSRNWKPKLIVFTSNFDPEPILQALPEFKRRVTSVQHLSQRYVSEVEGNTRPPLPRQAGSFNLDDALIELIGE